MAKTNISEFLRSPEYNAVSDYAIAIADYHCHSYLSPTYNIITRK